MIKSIELKNFESHKHTTLNFSNGLNAIIGSGDNGKSGIIRAIGWVLYNKPDGEGYISHWNLTKTGKIKGETSVTITTDKGWVKRCKSKNDNYYSINGEEYRAFGRNVPEEVADFLNLSDVNVQSQFSNHFLLSSSDSDVAKQLNQIAKLEKIDTSLQKANSFIRTTKSKQKHLQEDTKKLEETLKTYEGIDELDEGLAYIEFKLERRDKLQSSIERLTNITSEIVRLTSEISLLPDVDKVSKDLQKLTSSETTTTSLTRNISKVTSLIGNIVNTEKTLANIPNTDFIESSINQVLSTKQNCITIQTELTKLTNITNSITEYRKLLIPIKNTINSTEKTLNRLPNTDIIVNSLARLRSLRDSVIETETAISNATETVTTLKSNYKEILGDTCPLCGGTIHE